jgi:hypothetical protein
MPTEHILALLIEERNKLNAAIKALGHDGPFPMKPSPTGKRKVSAASRKKMAAAQKKRWAAKKAAK